MEDDVLKMAGAVRDQRRQKVIFRDLARNLQPEDGYSAFCRFEMAAKGKFPVHSRQKVDPILGG